MQRYHLVLHTEYHYWGDNYGVGDYSMDAIDRTCGIYASHPTLATYTRLSSSQH